MLDEITDFAMGGGGIALVIGWTVGLVALIGFKAFELTAIWITFGLVAFLVLRAHADDRRRFHAEMARRKKGVE